jgi:copper homeostasis protein
VTSTESAMLAERAGADRIELCDGLDDGGKTPSYGLIKSVKEKTNIPVHVMIRPRAGDFFYSGEEFEIMMHDIKIAKQLNADGAVFGILTQDGAVDIERTKQLIDIAQSMKITFHRAFDMTVDPFESLDVLVDCGVNSILTSGHRNTALEGAEQIFRLQQRAGKKIKIMAGSGVTDKTIVELATKTKVESFHASAKKIIGSQMFFKNRNVVLTSSKQISDYDLPTVDLEMIKAMKEKLNSFK